MRKINLIIVLCILSSVIFWVTKPNLILEYFAFSGENLFIKSRIWTPITSLFIHADFFHLLGNMLFLFIFGNTLEKEFGPTKTLSVFFTGGILSFILSLLFYDMSIPLIGASAAIFTLSAIVLLTKPLQLSILFFMPQGLIALLYFIYNLLAVYLSFEGNVAFISHLIGFAVGIPFGVAWSKNWLRNIFITIVLMILYALVLLIIVPAILSIIF